MQKRIFERIPANIGIRFFSGKTEYLGIVTNTPEKGMFISTKVNLPLEPQLEILIPLKEAILKLSAKITSFEKSAI